VYENFNKFRELATVVASAPCGRRHLRHRGEDDKPGEFGGIVTVAVPCQAGARGMTVVQEPTYNPDQAAYLALRVWPPPQYSELAVLLLLSGPRWLTPGDEAILRPCIPLSGLPLRCFLPLPD
jgi:hypothetical protein